MNNKPLAKAIEFKLRQLGKFDGADVQTREVLDGKTSAYEIVHWNVPGLARPDDATLESWISEEEAHSSAKESQRAAKMNALNGKVADALGVSSVSELKELLK